ncbi:MAG: hypothetical protein AAF533_14965 [Acidobacteriota bacterium]
MSRSIHQTLKSVFEGKSQREIDEMFEHGAPELLAWLEKHAIKQAVRDRRQLERLARELGEPLPAQLDSSGS